MSLANGFQMSARGFAFLGVRKEVAAETKPWRAGSRGGAGPGPPYHWLVKLSRLLAL